MTIWKFKLEVKYRQFITIPAIHRLLTVQMQDGIPCLWAIVEPGESTVCLRINCYGTGHPVDELNAEYLGTVQDGPLVWHFFA